VSTVRFHVELLSSQQDRSTFHSKSKALDLYFRQQVGQDMRRRVTTCFIALSDDARVAGYYTLASASVLLTDLPQAIGRKLPRYPTVPAVRMGRLAVDQAFKGQGLGAALLADALTRACHAEIAAYALVVDAKDEAAADFYRHHGFVAFGAAPLTLFIPLATARTQI
jgi:ribosomal protein S18 acetylase RimI-like enzyme